MLEGMNKIWIKHAVLLSLVAGVVIAAAGAAHKSTNDKIKEISREGKEGRERREGKEGAHSAKEFSSSLFEEEQVLFPGLEHCKHPQLCHDGSQKPKSKSAIE